MKSWKKKKDEKIKVQKAVYELSYTYGGIENRL